MLDMFFELLNIETPEWYQTFLDGRRLTSEPHLRLMQIEADLAVVYRKHKRISQQTKEQETPQKTSERLKLTDQFIALLTVIFTKAGLLDVRELLLLHSRSESSRIGVGCDTRRVGFGL